MKRRLGLAKISAFLLLLFSPTAFSDVGLDEETAVDGADSYYTPPAMAVGAAPNSSSPATAAKTGSMKAALAATERGPGFSVELHTRSPLPNASGSLNDSDAMAVSTAAAATTTASSATGGSVRTTPLRILYQEIVKTADLLGGGDR